MIESILNGLTLAQAANPATTGAAAPSQASAWLMFLFVVLVIVVPFVLGTLAARALRMKDISMKIGIVFFTVFLGHHALCLADRPGQEPDGCLADGDRPGRRRRPDLPDRHGQRPRRTRKRSRRKSCSG